MRPLTDSKHFRKDEFEIDLLANGGERNLSCGSDHEGLPHGPRGLAPARKAVPLPARGVRRMRA